MPKPLNIDLSNASHEELKSIHNEVLQRLAQRAGSPGVAADGYDRHGSGHSRSGGGIVQRGEEVINPAVLAAGAAKVTKPTK